MKIFDASAIICIFREIRFSKSLDICRKRGYTLTTTQQVFDEIKKNPKTLQEFMAFGNFTVIPVEDNQCLTKLSKRYPWLHSGEISVLCLGLQKKEEQARYYCIIDERARTLKDKLQIRIHGTVGLVLWLKDCGEITPDECHILYKRFVESSFRIKEEIIKGLIK